MLGWEWGAAAPLETGGSPPLHFYTLLSLCPLEAPALRTSQFRTGPGTERTLKRGKSRSGKSWKVQRGHPMDPHGKPESLVTCGQPLWEDLETANGPADWGGDCPLGLSEQPRFGNWVLQRVTAQGLLRPDSRWASGRARQILQGEGAFVTEHDLGRVSTLQERKAGSIPRLFPAAAQKQQPLQSTYRIVRSIRKAEFKQIWIHLLGKRIHQLIKSLD